jgi:hypothetical protein
LGAFAAWSQLNGMQTVTTINLPAALVDLPYAIFSEKHENWSPRHMNPRVWQAISCPILGMIFWWIAGCGADALVASRSRKLVPRIGWAETIIGFLLAAGGAVFVIAFVFTAGPDRSNLGLQLMAAVAGVWALLGGLTVAARIVQRRMRKALLRKGAVPV